MNNVVLVGRLTSDIEVQETEKGKKRSYFCLAVTRNFKNTDGIYETDFISCIVWNGIATAAKEYCHCGDVIGIKGRLQSSEYLDENEKKHYITEVVAEKITFLSSKKTDG